MTDDPTTRLSADDDDPASDGDADATRRVERPRGPTLGARYDVRGQLGEGGMADVLRCYDRQLDREVAVKVLHARYARDPAFLQRFQREARAVANLNHPNIVAVYDFGEEDGRPYIVMELVDGRSLRDEIRGAAERDGHMSVERAIQLVSDAALALDYAHERGLVHRDVKPGNILLTRGGEVKVTDFGIARAVDAETVTQTAAVFGTAAYMSPEQARSEGVDRRTDVYALGCVLHEALTGRQPYHADSAVALAHKHIAAPVPVPSSITPLDPSLDAIVATAMAKDPDQRYQTARDLVADLQRVLEGLPVASPAWAGSTQVLDATAAQPADDDVWYDEEPTRRRRGVGYALLALGVLAAVVAIAWLLSTLTVDAPVASVTVPDVRGQTERDARQILGDAGLTPVLADRVNDADVPLDRVVGTEPPAGVDVDEGSEVGLVLSNGPEMVEVPADLVGMPEGDARSAIAAAGLTVGTRTEETSDEIPEGSIVSTDPPSGAQVPLDSEVAIVVSTGTDDVEIPDLVGATEADARAALEGACDDPDPCLVVNVSRRFDADAPEGQVIEQSPQAGETVRPGSSVVIVVSRGPEEVPTTEPPPPEPTAEPTPEPQPSEGASAGLS